MVHDSHPKFLDLFPKQQSKRKQGLRQRVKQCIKRRRDKNEPENAPIESVQNKTNEDVFINIPQPHNAITFLAEDFPGSFGVTLLPDEYERFMNIRATRCSKKIE